MRASEGMDSSFKNGPWFSGEMGDKVVQDASPRTHADASIAPGITWETRLTALNFAAAGARCVHFKLLFSPLTKPLIHPETRGQVSAGAEERKKEKREEEEEEEFAGSLQEGLCQGADVCANKGPELLHLFKSTFDWKKRKERNPEAMCEL